MNEGARRTHNASAPRWWERLHLRHAAVGTMLVLSASILSSCSNESRPAESRRQEAKEPDRRRERQPRREDTTSLVTPLRVDSLVGAARGAGGEASLRTTCAQCHEGVHAAQLGRSEGASAVCIACHETSHETVRALYAGALPGHPAPADSMYLARVSCVDCHSDSTFALPAGAVRKEAMDRLCIACHGTRFRGMLATWQEGVTWRSHAVKSYVDAAASDSRLASGEAHARVRGAREAMELLRVGGAIHNVRGADHLVRAALDSVAAAYSRAGLAAPARPSLGPDAKESACLSCHYGVESRTKVVRDETFRHDSHIVRSDLPCSKCHSDAKYYINDGPHAKPKDQKLDPRHGKTTLTAASCDGCHHSPSPKIACTVCHATNDARLTRPIVVTVALKLQPPKAPNSRSVKFEHSVHAKSECTACHTTPGAVKEVATCSSCHTDHHKERARGCASCHGTTMLSTHTMDTHFKCASCHVRATVASLLPDRAFCLSCHVKQVTHEPAKECSTCHLHLTPTEVRRRILADQSKPAR